MTAFRCLPIATETAARFRRTGIDDAGNSVRPVAATADGGFPCRHCLHLASPGQTMLLGSYHLPRPRGIYWTPSPIFVHADDCPRFAADNTLAPIVDANSLVSVRAYDADDLCLYDLGVVCNGDAAADPVARALADPRAAFVNIHTARPGCLLTRVERLG